MIGEDESEEHGTKLSNTVFLRVEDLQDTVKNPLRRGLKAHAREAL